MDPEERQKKVEAGRAKLAHFRQRKAKGDGTHPPKKTSKRKGAAVHSHDLSAQERPLGTEEHLTDSALKQSNRTAKETDGELSSSSTIGDSHTEEELNSSIDQARLDVEVYKARIVDLEERLLGKQTAVDQLSIEVEHLKEKLALQTGAEQLQELETAVRNRDEVISQLSTNLQQAYQNREEVQLEALQLTDQIQALQLQLQDASDFLRSKSLGCVEIVQSQQQIHNLKDQSSQLDSLQKEALKLEQKVEELQQNTGDQQTLLTKKDDVITQLQQRLSCTESTISELQHILLLRDKEVLELRNEVLVLSASQEQQMSIEDVWINENSIHAQLQRLKNELEKANKVNEDEKKRSSLLEDQIKEMEKERKDMEDQLVRFQEDLRLAREQAKEALRYKEEKEKMNEEILKLGATVQKLEVKLQEGEEAIRQLREKYEADISNCNLQLQKLEREKETALAQLAESSDGALRLLRDEHRLEVQQLQQHLETQHGQSMDIYRQSIEDLRKNLNEIKARKDQANKETASESQEVFDCSFSQDDGQLMEKYLTSTKPKDSSWVDECVEQSLNEDSENHRFELDSEHLFHSDTVGSVQDELELTEDLTGLLPQNNLEPELGGESLSSVQWQKYTSALQELDGSGNDIDVEKALVMQQCADLNEQLNAKEKHLEILQAEVKEISEKWKKASEELEVMRLEVAKQQKINEDINCKKSQENLNDKLNLFGNPQDHHAKNQETNPMVKEASFTVSMDYVIKELKEEKEFLLTQLREQERLVKDVQEQKLAGDSVTSEVQALFGRQLLALQAQRDQLQAQLETQKAKHQTTSELLGQKTLKEDSLHRELQLLKTELEEKEQNLKKIVEEKNDLESRLICIEQNLVNADEALSQSNREKTDLEQRLAELEIKVKNLGSVLESEREDFSSQLKIKCQDILELEMQIKQTNILHLHKESVLELELSKLKESMVEQERVHVEALESLALEEAEKLEKAVKQAEAQLKSLFEEEKCKVEEHHQMEIKELNAEMEKRLSEQKSGLEEEQKKQIGLVKQIHEREHEREIAELLTKQKEELRCLRAELNSEQQELSDELKERMEAAYQAELHQVQMEKHLEIEALRLSLTNLHTAQLELSQNNLQRDKEAALSELQESLNAKRSQESAMLQTRMQFELERLREQHREQSQCVARQYQQEIDEMKNAWETEISELKTQMEENHANKIEALKLEWKEESEKSLGELQQRLNEKQAQLEELQSRSHQEIHRLEELLSCTCSERDSTTRALEDLEKKHGAALRELETRQQEEHASLLQELTTRNSEKGQLQQQMEKIQVEYDELKSRSEQEVANLWSQLESMRTSRQELGELKEQLLARSSHVEDLERLKQEFNQQRRDLQAHNELELENLRTYFEQRLRYAEESYREEITILQLRLEKGAKEESFLETGDVSCLSEGIVDEERSDLLGEITQKLEKHKEELDSLRLQLEDKHKQELENVKSYLLLQYKEDLLQVKTDLADRYFSEIEDLKTKHILDLEQLRAKLSDNHIKEITKLRLQSAQDVARQVEAEVAQRVRALNEEHSLSLAHLNLEREQVQQLERQIALLKEEHAENLKSLGEKYKELQKQAVEQVKQDSLEELQRKVEEARREEGEMVTRQFLGQKEEELQRQREELQAQAEERLVALGEELECLWKEEREALRKELQTREEEVNRLEEQLEEEHRQLQHLHHSLETEQNPHILAVRHKIQAQYDSELSTARATMAEELRELNAALQEQTEAKLQEAQSKFQEKENQLREEFALKQEAVLNELKVKHVQDLEAQKSSLQEHFCNQLEELKNAHQLQKDLKERHQAELEALEAELLAKHKAEKDELEARMLSNMDTLESTYLAEIQCIRNEKEQALQDLKTHFAESEREREKDHTVELERLRAEHQVQMTSATEELRKELAQVHIDKFKAMAAELKEAHKAELATALSDQQQCLEAERGQTLEALREEVQALEEQHSKALQELSELHSLERRRHEQHLAQQLAQDIDTLKAHHELQLQELSSTSAGELERVKRQLEEEMTRQQQQFQEEMELLKCQSEVLLEQQITQIKEEFEDEKRAALEQQSVKLLEAYEQRGEDHRGERDQLTTKLQKQAAVIIQLQEEVAVLQKEMEAKDSELETLLQRRERENEEGDNLVAMLRADLSCVTEQRNNLQDANERVLKLLLEVVKNAIATEDLISRKIAMCMGHGDELAEESQAEKAGAAWSQWGTRDMQEKGEAESVVGEMGANSSLWSALTDEGCELSQRLSESIFTGPELDRENEEVVLEVCHRIHSAVEKLLDLVAESHRQLEQTQGVQAHLEQEFSQGQEDTAQLVTHHQRVLQELQQEAALKNQLELELHKAEGLLEGYVVEKAALEEAVQQKEGEEQRLVEELEVLRGRLAELSEAHSLLLRQRDALTGSMDDNQKGLLEEAERLAREKLDLQRQAEKDRSGLTARLKLLESELEEQMSHNQELEERRRVQTEDLQQQIQALEKQLRNNRHFIDEQAVEREHERDEFQQEIQKLEAQLRFPVKSHAGGDNGSQKVETLQTNLKDKIEDYNVLLLAKEQYQQEATELTEENDKMAARMRELEQTALNNAVEAKRISHLEQELQKMKKIEQDLLQDKDALQQQQYTNRMQISALQSKLDETRHRFPESNVDQVLKEQLEAGQEALIGKEKQIEALNIQLEHIQRDLDTKSDEVLQLKMQLEVQMKQSSACVDQLQEEIIQLKETVSSLCRHQGEDTEDSASSMLLFPQALLEEKNQEIDHLNEQIMRLQQDMDNIRDNKVLEEKQAEVEELRSQVEHLLVDQERMRRNKEEEVEQLHEVIEKLQEELAQLGPNRHEVSDSQDSLELQDFWQHPSQEDSLGHELASQSLQSSRAHLKKLEAQLDLASTEKEAIQHLLQTQEETFRNQVENLGKSLQDERKQLETLQEESSLLRAHLSQRQAEVDLLAARVQELEDILRQREAQLVETELQVKTSEEQRDAALANLGHLPGKVMELEKELQLKKSETEELLRLQRETSAVDLELLKLQDQELKNREDAKVKKLETKVQDGLAEILHLATVKTELYTECQALRQREGHLQEEIERLKNEVTFKNTQIQELNLQLEEKIARNLEEQKEVLRGAEETLGKAECALREKEEQLAELKVEHDTLRAELAAVKEGLSSSTERAEKLLEEGQTKDKALVDLKIHNQKLKSELEGLQADLVMQEEELAYQQRELEQMRERYSFRAPSVVRDAYVKPCGPDEKSPEKYRGYLISLSGESSPCSPEVLRKYDSGMERGPDFQSSNLLELSTLHSTGLDLLHSKASTLERNCSQPPDHIPTDSEHPSTHSLGSHLDSEGNFSLLHSIDLEKAKDLDNLEFQSPSPECTASTVSVHEWVSDGYGSNSLGCNTFPDGSSEVGARLKLELETTERLDANFVEYLRQRGMTLPDDNSISQSAVKPEEDISPELQGLLKKVYDEACRVLLLSERSVPVSVMPTELPTGVMPESWHRETVALQEVIQSLKDLLSKLVDKEKECNDGADWRGELLQAVHSVFDRERDWLRSELHSISSRGPADISPLLDRLERLLKEQDEQRKVSLERLLTADRSSLLAEVQALQAQLRISSLQSQEQLQQLQSTLSSVEEQGNQRQHQLRRQVELLEYKLQQEQTLVSDLQNSLRAEQTRSAELRAHLRTEQEAVCELKKELSSSSQELHTATKAQQELQNEIQRLRSKLENEEARQQTSLEALEKEKQKIWELQHDLDQERLESQQRLDQEGKTHEVLRASLEERNLQNSQLCSALEQERIVSSNLRKELQIEQSRCEALLSQERSKLSEVQHQLEEERARCDKLRDSLGHEQQQLVEEYRQRMKEESLRREGAASQDRTFIQELQAHLEQERARSVELAAMMEKTQQQAIQTKRQLEADTQQTREGLLQEQEVSVKLRIALENLQIQKQELACSLDTEKQRVSQLQADLEALQEKIRAMKEKERTQEEQRERIRKQEQQELADRERKHARTVERLREMELQKQRDQQRMKQLQQTLAELEEQERELTSHRLQQAHTPNLRPARDSDALLRHHQQLQFMQQQLQLATLRLKDFIQSSQDRGGPGQSQSEEEDLQYLLSTLSSLDNDLKTLCSSIQRPAQTTSSLADRLLRENSDLTCRLTTLTVDKLELQRSVTRLEKELLMYTEQRKARDQLEPADIVPLSEKLAWQKEKAALQMALKKAESELSHVTAEIENRPVPESSSKLQRLYGKYLRAESFRKALVYQKKYLLLLLGGFQDCEQATLSLIARMDVYPSPGDLQEAIRSQPISRFRSAVRVVIAISRLRFLVKKWQKATRKGQLPTAVVNGAEHSKVPGIRTEVLRPHHSGLVFNSPPTRDFGVHQRSLVSQVVSSPKSPFRLHNRSCPSSILLKADQSHSPSHDPEHSLTEYIHHLEAIQQRLGGLQPGSPAGLPYSRKSNR
nr:PREDICTED: pericentrin isoform X2 [Lepisosteus oculatus]